MKEGTPRHSAIFYIHGTSQGTQLIHSQALQVPSLLLLTLHLLFMKFDKSVRSALAEQEPAYRHEMK
jgi:hypothetical protein